MLSVGQASSYTASLKGTKQPDTGCWERLLSAGEARGETLQEPGKCRGTIVGVGRGRSSYRVDLPGDLEGIMQALAYFSAG